MITRTIILVWEFSAKIWKINFYGILDNLTKLSDISSANNVSLQFGFNLLFN